MIPTIGVMIGCYICTRMFDLAAGKTKYGRPITVISAILTILITTFCMLDLAISGSRLTPPGL